MHVLNHLGVGDAIGSLSVCPGAYVFRLHDTGEVIGQVPASVGWVEAQSTDTHRRGFRLTPQPK
jgi:hypothetical protein